MQTYIYSSNLQIRITYNVNPGYLASQLFYSWMLTLVTYTILVKQMLENSVQLFIYIYQIRKHRI